MKPLPSAGFVNAGPPSTRNLILSDLCPLLLALPLLLVGCGDDGPSTPDAGPLPIDQCANAADLAIVNALAPVPDGGFPDAGTPDQLITYAAVDELNVYVEACTRGACQQPIIYDSPDAAQCMEDCLVGTPAEGLSEGCTACWPELIKCAVDNCVLECLGTDYAECIACTDTYCGARFHDCMGFYPDP